MGLRLVDEPCWADEGWQRVLVPNPILTVLVSLSRLVFVRMLTGGDKPLMLVVVIGVALLISSIAVAPPTNIGDCLARVGDVGIKVPSSSSIFVWVHFELVPGNTQVFDGIFTLLPSDAFPDC